MKRLQPFWLACALLTTLPVGSLVHTPVASRDSGRSVVCYPLVGLLIGLLVAGFAALLAGVHAGLAAVLTLAVWVALSGALHLDGLADARCLFAGHRDPERCLAVMRDPAAGPMAVVALVLLLLTKAAALTVLVGTGDALALVAAPVLARWARPCSWRPRPIAGPAAWPRPWPRGCRGGPRPWRWPRWRSSGCSSSARAAG